jgi:hypothetical protein
MTTQKSLKRRVRARMAKTGERYAAARRQLLAAAPRSPSPEPAAATSPELANAVTSDEIVLARTGRRHAEWFALLDAWGAPGRSHTEIAAWLSGEHGVPSWWRQEITVSYERAIGRRQLGQHADGFSVTASKTIGVPVERLFDAVVDDEIRARWLTGVTLRVRTATRARSARFDVDDGSSRLAVGFDTRGSDRSQIALSHDRLPDAAAADRQRAFWRAALVELQAHLEG